MTTEKRLLLLRHAKSSWDDPSLSDRERPLAPRGRKATKLLSGHLHSAGIAPEVVLCSPSQRTRETFDRIRAAFDDDIAVSFEDELYGASAEALLARLRELDEQIGSAMLIGHNPAIAELARGLAGSGTKREDLDGKYPTGALATIVFAGSWRELGPGTGELAAFVTPKELARS